MRKSVLAILAAFVLTVGPVSVFGQEGPAKPPQPKPEPQKEEPEAPDKLATVVYLDVQDKLNGKPYKWRVVEYIIAKTFELANTQNKKNVKDEWRKKYDSSKLSPKQIEKKLEKQYKELRKQKGVDKLDLHHIKLIRWRPKKKRKKDKDETKKEEPDTPKKDDKSGAGEGEEPPEEEGEMEEPPAEPPSRTARRPPGWARPWDTIPSARCTSALSAGLTARLSRNSKRSSSTQARRARKRRIVTL